MQEQAQSPEAAELSKMREQAMLALREHRLASVCIFLFLALNIAAQLLFKANGSGMLANLMLIPSSALLLWTFFKRFPMPFLRAYGAFCAGLFACLAYNSSDSPKALALFAYWIVLSILTIRMKRAITAFFFLVSLALLTQLV